MGFSGKPSRGCAPCRAKRTKCDLAQPSCTQCKRKGRECVGYRSEQDMLFKNETNVVVRKAKRKFEEQTEQTPPVDRVAMEAIRAWKPSRWATIEEEAMLHFFAHYNEKSFAGDGHNHRGGFDFVMPVYQQDLLAGGPVPDIVKASGLAALGNLKGSQELLEAARHKQGQVLRQLTKQLQDHRTCVSDSSILTCVMLGIFENIICDSQSTQAMTYHLRGASALAQMRGPAQFNNDIGHAIYARMRGFILAHCLQTRDPLPEFIVAFSEDESILQRDFELGFYKLLARLCQVRANLKKKGFVDVDMAREAEQLTQLFGEWQPSLIDWQPGTRPTARANMKEHDEDVCRFGWLATIWLFKHTARIQSLDIVVEWAREQNTLSLGPDSSAKATLDDAVNTQWQLCDELKTSTSYYLEYFKDTESSMRMIGGYGLLWPLYVLSMSATTTSDMVMWIGEHADKIAEEFGIRQGRAMAQFMRTHT